MGTKTWNKKIVLNIIIKYIRRGQLYMYMRTKKTTQLLSVINKWKTFQINIPLKEGRLQIEQNLVWCRTKSLELTII